MSSPTPKPVQTMHTEPSIVHSPLASHIKRVQSPALETIPQEPQQPQAAVAHASEPPLIVDRPQSNSLDDSIQLDDPKEFEVPSAPNTPPPPINVSLAVDQSPRARALAEALFGPEPAPARLSPSPNASTTPQTPSAEDLQQEVQLKAAAATAALKSPVDPISPLRRKTTKRIDLQKISGPQLVSASMSVDAIPLASPSSASLARAVSPEGKQGGSKLGDRLRRLRGSIRNKPQVVTTTHTRDQSASTILTIEPVSAGPATSQVVSYNPQNLQTPQVRSVPVITTNSSPPTGSPMSSPQATPSSAGIKSFMSRLRPKGRKDELAGSLQPSAFSSSPQVNETLSRATSVHLRNRVDSSRSGPLPARTHIIATPTSDPSPPPATTTPGSPDPDAVQKLFNAARDLGLDPAAIQQLLEKTKAQATNPTPFASLPDLGERKVDEPNPRDNGQPSSELSRQPSTKVKIEPTPRARPAREGANPVSSVVRRTIIYPSTSTNAAPTPSRMMGLQRKLSSASRRRPVSVQSQFSARSVHDRVPTPPPPRGAAARRMSEDGHAPPLPSSILSPNGRPSTSAGVMYVLSPLLPLLPRTCH